MFEVKRPVTSRAKRIAVLGAAMALLLSGGTVALSQTSAFAISAGTMTTTSIAVSGKDTVLLPGQQIRTSVNFNGLQGKRYQHISKIVDKVTGKDIGAWAGAPFNAASTGYGSYAWNITVPAEAAGKEIVVFAYIFDIDSVTGTTLLPTGIKPGFGPVAQMTDINSAANTFKVGGDPVLVTPVAPRAAAATTPVTIATVATDKADGDKTLIKGGVIKDVVSFTGLNPGSVYVLHTQLFNKTDGKLTTYTQAKIFTAKTATDTITVEAPVPDELVGKEVVVYQTLYYGNDVVVGKHLDRVVLRDGIKPAVAEIDPTKTEQTVTVVAPTKPCTISGYVWKDSNNNGKMDADEAKVPNVKVDARKVAATDTGDIPGEFIATTTTDANGFYKIEIPEAQCGTVFIDWNEANFPDGWKPFNGGESDLRDSTKGIDEAWSKPVEVPIGTNVERVDAGLRQVPTTTTAMITGDVCRQLVLRNYRVLLFDATNTRIKEVDIVNNQFQIADLAPGDYRIEYYGNHQTTPFWAIRNGDLINRSSSFVMLGANGTHNEQGLAFTSTFTLKADQVFHLNSCGYSSSPLALDLNNSGAIDTASVASQGAASFDLLQTGEAVQSGWLAQGDGFLVAPNADGTITSGANLFGGALGEGFAQLGSYDKDGNGVVSGAELAGLKVWVDSNNDHVAQPGEIKNLSDYGIAALNVAYSNSPVVNNGNVVVEHGTAVKADGSSVVLGDAYFTIAAASAANQVALSVQAAKSEAHLATLPAAEATAIRGAFAGR